MKQMKKHKEKKVAFTYFCLIFFQRSMWSHIKEPDIVNESVNCGKSAGLVSFISLQFV